MARIQKARFWVGVLYQENMLPDWETKIGDIVQVPYAYCCHTKDKDTKSEHRKDHVHLILAFANTTTYKHALSIFGLLSAEGKTAINTAQAIINIRNMYDYLIHDTETCRKNGKERYLPEERITGNNFDIGSYEQLGVAEKNDMCKELCTAIMDNGFTNFADFYMFVVNAYDDTNYFEILKTYSGLFERLTRANFQKLQFASMMKEPTSEEDTNGASEEDKTESSEE